MNAKSNPTETEETQNDEIVGAALRWSVAVIVLLTVAGVSFWWLNRTPEEKIAKTAGPTALPVARPAPAMVIPEIPFTEMTAAAGIDFMHENGAEGEKLLPETMGGGGAFLDFDNDGDQDLLCINSNVWPWAKEQPDKPPT